MSTRKRIGDLLLRTPEPARGLWFALYKASLHGMGYGAATLPMSSSGDEQALGKGLERLGKGSRVIFDVGAHTGEFASRALSAFGPQSRVWCFEPAHNAFETLSQRLRTERATLVQKAAGDAPGAATLIGEGPTARLDKGPGGQEVEVIRLDTYAAEHGIDRIDYLKLDAEGGDYAALVGTKRLLDASAIGCVQFEFGSLSITAHTFLRDFYDLLGPRWDFFRLTSRAAVPLGTYRPELEVFVSETNYLAIRGRE
jgi:FkbM family methyltransferase